MVEIEMRVTMKLNHIWSTGKEEENKIKTLAFREADFGKFREQVGKNLYEDSLLKKGEKEKLIYFRRYKYCR